MVDRARNLVSLYDEMVAEVRMESLRCGSSIKVGYFHSASFSILAAGKRLFKSIHPDIEMSVKSLYPQDLRDALDSDELDIIISLFPIDAMPSPFDYKVIYKDEFSLMMLPSNPLAIFDEVPPAKISSPVLIPRNFPRDRFFNRRIPEILDAQGISFDLIDSINDAESYPLAFENVDCVLLACNHFKKFFGNRFVFAPIAGADLRYNICVAWKKSRTNPALESLANCLCLAYEVLSENGDEKLL